MSNVQPGMLAIVRNSGSKYDNSLIVEVLKLAPNRELFKLPNGHNAFMFDDDLTWVVYTIGYPIPNRISDGLGNYISGNPTNYHMIQDKFLKPLPGDDEDMNIQENQGIDVSC